MSARRDGSSDTRNKFISDRSYVTNLIGITVGHEIMVVGSVSVELIGREPSDFCEQPTIYRVTGFRPKPETEETDGQRNEKGDEHE